MISRSEASGLSLAVVGHVVLFGLLSVGFLATPNPMLLRPTPIEVSITDEVGLESMAPEVSSEAPAARLAEVEGPVESVVAPEAPSRPEPVTRPEPSPQRVSPEGSTEPRRRPDSASAVTAAPSREPRDLRATGRLDGIVEGLSDRRSESISTRPPAAVAGPAVQASINAEIRRQLKPHWRSPSGADVELLRTIVELRLNPDGSLADEPRLVRQEGVNASNRPQAGLHLEQAIKAIKLAAPFRNLPPEYYDYWKRTGPAFDRRLSQ